MPGPGKALIAAGVAILALASWSCSPGADRGCDARSGCEWPLAPEGGLSVDAAALQAPLRVSSLELPAGSRQEEGRWYRLDLSLVVTLNTGVDPMQLARALPAYLSLAVDGGTAFQLKLGQPDPPETVRCGDGSRPAVEWSTYGLVRGSQRGLFPCDGVQRIEFSNFLQDRSVRPGTVAVTLLFESTAPGLLESVTILPGSRIVVTREGPPRIEVIPRRKGLRGSPGGFAADLELEVRIDGTPTDAATVTLGRLDETGRITGTLEASREGLTYRAPLSWRGGGEATWLVNVTTPRGGTLEFIAMKPNASGGRLGAIAAALLVGGGLLLAGFLAPGALPTARRLARLRPRRPGAG